MESRLGSKFRKGEKVFYRGMWGEKLPRKTTIIEVGTKGGRVVYDNDLGHWGYEYQYKRELPFPVPPSID